MLKKSFILVVSYIKKPIDNRFEKSVDNSGKELEC